MWGYYYSYEGSNIGPMQTNLKISDENVSHKFKIYTKESFKCRSIHYPAYAVKDGNMNWLKVIMSNNKKKIFTKKTWESADNIPNI